MTFDSTVLYCTALSVKRLGRDISCILVDVRDFPRDQSTGRQLRPVQLSFRKSVSSTARPFSLCARGILTARVSESSNVWGDEFKLEASNETKHRDLIPEFAPNLV